MKMVKRKIQIAIPENLVPGLVTPFATNPPSNEEMTLFLTSLVAWSGSDMEALHAEQSVAPSWVRLVAFLAGNLLPRFSSTRPSSRPGRRAATATPFQGLPLAESDARWLVASVARVQAEQQAGRSEGRREGVAAVCKRLQANKAEPCPAIYRKMKNTTMAKHYFSARKRLTRPPGRNALAELAASLRQ